MPYRFLTFDGVELPTHKPVDDLSTAVSEQAVINTVNGNIDALGSTRANNKPQIIEYTGIYTDSAAYLVTETEENLVTEDGYYLWTGSDVERALDNLRRRRGVRGVLIRQRDSDGAQHWKYARLIQCEFKRVVENANVVAPMRLVFELSDQNWSDLTEVSTSATLAASATTNVAVTVTGTETVADAVIEVTATNWIYGIDITIGSNQKLQWAYASPPVAPGNTIIFNCGKFTVTEGGTSRYIGFNLGTAHTIQDWLELAPGSNTIGFALNGGGGSVYIHFYNQYS